MALIPRLHVLSARMSLTKWLVSFDPVIGSIDCNSSASGFTILWQGFQSWCSQLWAGSKVQKWLLSDSGGFSQRRRYGLGRHPEIVSTIQYFLHCPVESSGTQLLFLSIESVALFTLVVLL